MRYICAWCKKETKPPDGNHDELESHGICEECYPIALGEPRKQLIFLKEMEGLNG